MNIVVTGGTGYVGERLIDTALRQGHHVLSLSRRPPAGNELAWLRYALSDAQAPNLPALTHALFHLAAHTQDAQGSEEMEVEAARKLIAAAGRTGAKFVFVSSQSARQDSPTPYGRIKWRIEQITLQAGGVVVRPGQVYGGHERGLFGIICGLVRRLPVLPVFLPEPVLQPVHVDDLAAALLASLEQPSSSLFCVAAQQGVGFSRFLRAIADERVRRCRAFVPVPTGLIDLAAKALGPRVAGRLGLDRLRSLFALPRMHTQRDLQQLGVTLRPMAIGMTRSGSARRLLLREAHCMLAYVLRGEPDGSLMRRYVRAIETLRLGNALALPRMVLRFPALLGLLEGGADGSSDAELWWRLDTATVIAEASPQGARRCLGLGRRQGPTYAIARIARGLLAESLRRIGRAVMRPLQVRPRHMGSNE